MKICIDPGHGGKTSGAVGKKSIEKNINLEVSMKLKERLERSGINIVMTRQSDVYVSLQGRCDIANKADCDYFISIHCNGFNDPRANGTSTFYYRGSKKGWGLAKAIQSVAVEFNKNKDRGVMTADFYVIKYTDMPAVLLEMMFITSEKEENMLSDSDWQDGFTKSIAIAICNHLGIAPNVIL